MRGMTGLNIQAPVLALIRLGHGLDQASAYITTACTCQSCDVVSCELPITVDAILTVFVAEPVATYRLKTDGEHAYQEQASRHPEGPLE